MVSIAAFRKLALSFEEAVELPHFDRASFRVSKKIFATLREPASRACLMLSPEDQALFGSFDLNVIYPVPNKWGRKGATYVELKKIRKELLKEALTVAYCRVAPKKLAALYRQPGAPK